MEFLKLAENELFEYKPPLTRKDDFNEFWDRTIEQTKQVPLDSCLKEYDYPSPYVKVYDISYCGFDTTRIHGWYIVPQFNKNKYPCLINYHGYGANREVPTKFMHWAMQGVAVLAIDCRGQKGITGNNAVYNSGHGFGLASLGILDKNEYYFRAVYMDCLKAIDFVCEQPEVDPNRIILHGSSQGGSLVVAVSALDSRPYAAFADVPSNSNLTERVIGFYGAFSGVSNFLKVYPHHTSKAFETLSYFDTMNMADRIKCKIMASVGLKDDICPAKLFFATYNRITSEKSVEIYPFNGHGDVGIVHGEKKLKMLQEIIK